MLADRERLLARLEAIKPELIAIRRDIHRYPETGFEETRTAALAAEKLSHWGVDVVEGIGKTGVVATLVGASSSSAALLKSPRPRRRSMAARGNSTTFAAIPRSSIPRRRPKSPPTRREKSSAKAQSTSTRQPPCSPKISPSCSKRARAPSS
jgi:hypothetical protein